MIYGNEIVIKSINNSIEFNNFSHSYIFNGESGLGKTTISSFFAKSLLCLNKKKPCNICKSCIATKNNNNPDIIFVSPTKSSLGIDDIRKQIIEKVNIKPFYYKYKIFIIKNCEKMTTQAQNAILKTIEEPPPNTLFFLLTTNYNNFLETIISRCIIYKIKPVTKEQVFKYLINNNFTIDDANYLKNFSNGNIGLALKIANDTNFKLQYNEIIEIILKIQKMDIIYIFNISKNFEIYKENIYPLLEALLIFFRDMIVYKKTLDEKFIINTSLKNYIYENYNNFSSKKIFNILNCIINTKKQLLSNSNYTLTIEIMLLKIKEK